MFILPHEMSALRTKRNDEKNSSLPSPIKEKWDDAQVVINNELEGIGGIGNECSNEVKDGNRTCNAITYCNDESECVLASWFIIVVVLLVLILFGMVACCIMKKLGRCCCGRD